MRLPETKAKSRVLRAINGFNAYTITRVKNFDPAFLVWGDVEAERAHEEDHHRYFAYTAEDSDGVHVAKDLGQLDDRFLYGIVAHEFGHLISGHIYGDWSEEGADNVVEDLLDIVIMYGTPLELQNITCPEVHAVKATLIEEFRP